MTSTDEARDRYIRDELDKVTPDDTGIIRVQFTGEGASKHLNITAAQYEAIGKILAEGGREPDPSPVSYDPCITGTITANGESSEFMIPFANDSVAYTQWGAFNPTLWPRTDLLEGMGEAAREWYIHNHEDKDEDDE